MQDSMICGVSVLLEEVAREEEEFGKKLFRQESALQPVVTFQLLWPGIVSQLSILNNTPIKIILLGDQ